MPIKKIEITWECKNCTNIYQIINSGQGACPECGFNVSLLGIDALIEEMEEEK